MKTLLQYSLADDAAVALVPVQDDLPIEPFLDDEAVDDNRRVRVRESESHARSFRDRLPAGARQAVHRRVNRVALALALVVADVERHRGSPGRRQVVPIEYSSTPSTASTSSRELRRFAGPSSRPSLVRQRLRAAPRAARASGSIARSRTQPLARKQTRQNEQPRGHNRSSVRRPSDTGAGGTADRGARRISTCVTANSISERERRTRASRRTCGRSPARLRRRSSARRRRCRPRAPRWRRSRSEWSTTQSPTRTPARGSVK